MGVVSYERGTPVVVGSEEYPDEVGGVGGDRIVVSMRVRQTRLYRYGYTSFGSIRIEKLVCINADGKSRLYRYG